MGFFDSIASGLVSGIITPITNTITSIFNKKEDTELGKYTVDGKVDITLLQEDTKRLQAQLELNKTLSQYAIDRFMRYGLTVPVIWWFAAYMWDSAFRNILPHGWTWTVLTPEPQVMYFIAMIFGFIFVHSSVESFRTKK